MKKILSFFGTLIILTILGTIFRIIIKEGLFSYFKYFDLYSFQLDLIFMSIIVAFFIVVYRIVFKLCIKRLSLSAQAISMAILTFLIMYVVSSFGNPYTISFKITQAEIEGFTPIVIISFLLPYSEEILSKLTNKVWKDQ